MSKVDYACAGGLNCEHFQLLHVCVSARTPCDVGKQQHVKLNDKKHSVPVAYCYVNKNSGVCVCVKIKRDHKPVKTCLKKITIMITLTSSMRRNSIKLSTQSRLYCCGCKHFCFVLFFPLGLCLYLHTLHCVKHTRSHWLV